MYWYVRLVVADTYPISWSHLFKFPGHALHDKGLQRQKGVVPLVGSQEQRALLVPVINR